MFSFGHTAWLGNFSGQTATKNISNISSSSYSNSNSSSVTAALRWWHRLVALRWSPST